jgi:hypothetical protein
MPKNAIKIEPQPNHIVLVEKYVMGVTKVVRTSKMSEYMRELRSNWIGVSLSWNKRPREKAPRIFEMAEPTILPMARDARLRARDAITTASYDVKGG